MINELKDNLIIEMGKSHDGISYIYNVTRCYYVHFLLRQVGWKRRKKKIGRIGWVAICISARY